MAKGSRPSHRLVRVTKDKNAEGRREYTDTAAGWPSEQKPGSFGVKFEQGMKFKDADGKVFDCADFFWNWEPTRPFKDEPADDVAEEPDGGF